MTAPSALRGLAVSSVFAASDGVSKCNVRVGKANSTPKSFARSHDPKKDSGEDFLELNPALYGDDVSQNLVEYGRCPEIGWHSQLSKG